MLQLPGMRGFRAHMVRSFYDVSQEGLVGTPLTEIEASGGNRGNGEQRLAHTDSWNEVLDSKGPNDRFSRLWARYM
jgi:hypothetical protein